MRLGRSASKAARPDVSTAAAGETAAADGVAPHAQLGQLLVGKDALTSRQLAEALRQQQESGKRLGALLVEVGLVDEREITAALAEQLQLPVADLGVVTPAPDAAALLPEPLARSLAVLPLGLDDDGALRVVVGEPGENVEPDLRKAVDRPVRLLLATPSEVRRAVDATYRALSGVEQHVAAFTAGHTQREAVRAKATAEALTEDAPVVQVVNMIITQGLRDRASDVHIEPQDGQVRVRYRIDGALKEAVTLPGEIASALASRIKIMAGMNIVERRRPQDGQIAMEIDDRPVDIRVATTGTIWGEKVVLRILDKSRGVYKLDDLGMPGDTHDAFSRLVRAPFGMVLCAGPTGSGKTTTLYATLAEINEAQRNIMTIEDPVEYVFPSINQIQMNEQAGLSFATGLKSILRQDPDVILVGEIRDVETARIATQSALTGHFVLSSLHATDAVAALHRFLDMGIESFLIASSVLGVVGQRLVRRTCTHCRRPYEPSDEELAFYEESGGKPKDTFYRGEGCNFCSGTGYSDRIGVYELLRLTPEIKRLVVGWATQDELRRMAVKQGMRTLRDEGVALVEQDLTTIAEVVRNIYTA